MVDRFLLSWIKFAGDQPMIYWPGVAIFLIVILPFISSMIGM